MTRCERCGAVIGFTKHLSEDGSCLCSDCRTAASRPSLQLVLKPRRKKMYSVWANFEWDGDQERARFLHPGDAYRYAAYLQDEAPTFAIPLIAIRCET